MKDNGSSAPPATTPDLEMRNGKYYPSGMSGQCYLSQDALLLQFAPQIPTALGKLKLLQVTLKSLTLLEAR